MCFNIRCTFVNPSTDINTNNIPLKQPYSLPFINIGTQCFSSLVGFSRHSGDGVWVLCNGHFQSQATSICIGVVRLFLNKQQSSFLLSRRNPPFCPVPLPRGISRLQSQMKVFSLLLVRAVHWNLALGVFVGGTRGPRDESLWHETVVAPCCYNLTLSAFTGVWPQP